MEVNDYRQLSGYQHSSEYLIYILQNILFYVQQKKETHKDLEHLYIDYILFEFVWYIYNL